MMNSSTGIATVIGIVFACGLPGWAIVRWVFNFIQKNQNKDITEIAKEIKEAL